MKCQNSKFDQQSDSAIEHLCCHLSSYVAIFKWPFGQSKGVCGEVLYHSIALASYSRLIAPNSQKLLFQG